MTVNIPQPFDPLTFLDQLIEEMGLSNEAPEKVATLKDKMATNLHNKIFEAASEAMEPEVIDEAVEKYKDEKDMWSFLLKLLEMSPAAQEAMSKAVEEFREETLAAYQILSGKE